MKSFLFFHKEKSKERTPKREGKGLVPGLLMMAIRSMEFLLLLVYFFLYFVLKHILEFDRPMEKDSWKHNLES
jgi:hypothetical protein